MHTSKIFKLTNKHRTLTLNSPKVMGILNVTPDSFSDGGKFTHPDKALNHVEYMIKHGAELIDIGGESTRPGADEVSIDEEMARTLPVIEAVRKRFDVWISIDTSKPILMHEAHLAGADLINDVRALEMPGAVDIAQKSQLPVCLMHRQGEPKNMQNNPTYDNVTTDVIDYLTKRIEQVTKAGISSNNILIDPGFGFGKTDAHNYQLLNSLEALHALNCPILIGLSRKRMIQHAIDNYSHKELHDNRMLGSVTAAIISAFKGAHILRVHDVKETFEALSVIKAMQANM